MRRAGRGPGRSSDSLAPARTAALEAERAASAEKMALLQSAETKLRDTFASQLITCGVPLGYVSRQLGHADLAVTAQHYAKWAGGDDYRDPLLRRPGEVPADFLARLPGMKSQQVPNSFERKAAISLVGRTGLEPVTSAV